MYTDQPRHVFPYPHIRVFGHVHFNMRATVSPFGFALATSKDFLSDSKATICWLEAAVGGLNVDKKAKEKQFPLPKTLY